LGIVPVTAVVTDPADADRLSELGRSAASLGESFDIVCTSKWLRQHLVEAGVPPKVTVVIRAAVDFDELHDATNSLQRPDLGLPGGGPVLLTPSPPSRCAGTFNVAWASAILKQLWPELRLIVPGVSYEQARIRRLRDEIYCPEVYVLTENRYSPAELLAVSDVLVVPAAGDMETGWLALAMSAGVPIVASDVPSTRELITDGHSGFLCKPGQVDVLARRLRTAIAADDLRTRCAEEALEQARELFSAERCVDAFLQIIDNLARGDRAVGGVPDAATIDE
jgi:glycosyltransferase involved in cell wall biosynthesis